MDRAVRSFSFVGPPDPERHGSTTLVEDQRRYRDAFMQCKQQNPSLDMRDTKQ